MTPVTDHEAAVDELVNEIGYLELQANGLGRRLFAEVQEPERLVVQFPEAAEGIRPGIRTRMLRTLRYSLIHSTPISAKDATSGAAEMRSAVS